MSIYTYCKSEMLPRQIAQCLNQFLREDFREPFTALDLGCGDGVFSRQVFEGANLRAYCGMDETAKAGVFSHISQSDYPETGSMLQTGAGASGYKICDKLYDGAWETEQIWVLGCD